jgi:hypothetical protein
VHQRLGATVWEAETSLELAALGAAGNHTERATQLAAELGLHGVAAQLTTSSGARSGEPPTRSYAATESCGGSATTATRPTSATSKD